MLNLIWCLWKIQNNALNVSCLDNLLFDSDTPVQFYVQVASRWKFTAGHHLLLLTLIGPGEVKVDLANFDLKLQENLLST